MQKAKSRLATSSTNITLPAGPMVETTKKPFFHKYLAHLPTLFFAIVGWILLIYIFTNVEPDKIKDIIIPNSYFLILVLFYMTNFFTWSFVFLNSGRGLILAGFLSCWLFLQLQQVLFTPLLLIFFSGFWAILILGYEIFHRIKSTVKK